MRTCKGFTLLEVLIAMAVLALSLVALTQTVGTYAANEAYLRDRTLAYWVARNLLAEWQIAEEWPATGQRSETAEMAGQEWEWQAQIIQTADADLRRVELEIRHTGQRDVVFAKLVGFLAKR